MIKCFPGNWNASFNRTKSTSMNKKVFNIQQGKNWKHLAFRQKESDIQKEGKYSQEWAEKPLSTKE